jgi:nitrate/nitrite transporter NarK
LLQILPSSTADRDDTDLARATMRRVSLRLLPFLFLIYIFNFLDRTNVAIAALQMNRDLHFSTTAYGFGAGIREALQASNTTTGLITGGIACAAAGMMLAVGAISDRTGERYFHASACAVLAAVGCVSASLLPHPLARVAGLALVPVGVYGFYPPFWCLPTVLLRGTAAAAGIALVGSLGHVGGFVGPYVVGLLTDTTGGASGALLGLGCLSLSAAALCLVLRRQSAGRLPLSCAQV